PRLLRFFQKRPIGEHVYRNLEDIKPELSTKIVHFLPKFVGFAYSVAVKCVLLSFIDPWLAVILLAYVIPFGVSQHYMYCHLQRFHVRMREESQKQFALMREGLAGIKTLKSLGRESRQIRQYTKQHVILTRVMFGYRWMRRLTDRLGWLIGEFLRRGIWLYVGYKALKGEMTIGQFTAIILLVKTAERPLTTFLYSIQRQRLGFVPARRVMETLDVSTDLPEPEDERELPPINGGIECDHVTFGYDPGRPVLKDVSFTIEAGQKVGIVGPSGGGKSTLMHLLMRLYDPDSGSIRIDEHDLREVTSESYHRQLGVMLQETFLYNETIRNNITFLNSNITDEQVRRGGEMAEVERFVNDEPEGYDRVIDEECNISGGQRQRIGIARALVHDPRLLLFEDPTSALDAQEEELVMNAVKKALEGRTGVIVTHRLNNIADADLILVIADGRLVEKGVHEELLVSGGAYTRMWKAQMKD
ncbi:ABC transporter ATP-binding protein, partial [Candidatus Hydrogenedentota bacterium]